MFDKNPNHHGTSLGLNGYFIRLAGDDEPKLRKVRTPIYIDPELLPFVDRAVMPDVEREYTEDNADFDDFIWFPTDYEPLLDEDDRPGIAILADKTRIILEFDNEPALDDAKPTEEQQRILAAIEEEQLERELTEAEEFTPSFAGYARANVRRINWCERRFLREKNAPVQLKQHYEKLRGKAHRQPGGWKAYSPHGRETIRKMAVEEVSHFTAEMYLDANSRVNFH